MAADLLRRIRRRYGAASARFAMDDADPVVRLRASLRSWRKYWVRRGDSLALDIAELFATRTQASFEREFRKRLATVGFTVRFRPTEQMISAYRAVVAENVSLIRSIPQQFAKDVEGAVWRSAMKGGGMYELSRDIQQKYGVTYRRAAFISRDQQSKAHSCFEQARRSELGITKAIWRHSSAGKVPRPTHLKMDGQEFEIAKGIWDTAVEEWVLPGFLPNCRCTSRAIIPE
jgi:SPP1 gp7 family putative phage head morphogenesis protein